jgi:hypothetical protein
MLLQQQELACGLVGHDKERDRAFLQHRGISWGNWRRKWIKIKGGW